MDKQVIIQMEINIIKDSILRLVKLIDTRPEAYAIKTQIERFLFNKMFYYFKS